MILVDTSLWIDWIRQKTLPSNFEFRTIATCPPVIQEILQGLKWDRAGSLVREGFLALPCLDSNLPLDRFLHAAEIYREGRDRGLTIRSSIDCLIAAIAIHHRIPVLHKDRDFEQIAKFTSLKLHRN